jgi:uncharacterized membrane protein (UPF0127 family)
MLFDFKKRTEGYYEHEKNMNPLDMIFINKNKEVVAVRSLMPGNFDCRRDTTCS